MTISVPLACCVRPIAQSELVFGPRAYSSAARPILSAGMPVIFAALSSVYGFTAMRTFSKSCVRAAMNALFSRPSDRMWFSIAE